MMLAIIFQHLFYFTLFQSTFARDESLFRNTMVHCCVTTIPQNIALGSQSNNLEVVVDLINTALL